MEKINNNIDFDDDTFTGSYGNDLIDKLYYSLSQLKEEKELIGSFDEETLGEFNTCILLLRGLIKDGRNQLTNYMISSILNIDSNKKEELLNLKHNTKVFNDRLIYITEVLDEVNEEMWNLIGSYSNYWRKK